MQSGSVDNLSKMADRRRRRVLEDEGEEQENVPTTAKERPSECESEGDQADAEVRSESAAEDTCDGEGEEDSEEGSEEETEEETEEGSEEDDDDEEYTDDDVIIEGEEGQIEEERQSGDGEEQPDKENVDDDEDKKNPAYVPRKGAFYEHDLRTGEDDDVVEEPLKPKKKLWQDEGKWAHDRFHEDQQAPKSRDELMGLYGYDIRASDKPPDAPPARKMRGRGRGRPQRRSELADFMEPQSRPRSPPPPPEPQQPQRMAVIDTTDYGHKQRSRPQPPPPPPPEAFEDIDDDIDVPYMTTIDTSQSSAHSYQPAGQRRRGSGPRRDRQSFEENQSRNSRHGYEEQQNYRERRAYGDRGGRQGVNSYGAPSRDSRFSQSQDVRLLPQDNSYTQDYPSLDRAGGRSYDGMSQGPRGPRAQTEHRNRNNRYVDNEVGSDFDQRNSYSRGPRGGSQSQGGTYNTSRGRERNDRNNRPPRYSRMEREERLNNAARDIVPAAREYTNSSFRGTPSADDTAAAAEINPPAPVDAAAPGLANDRQTSQDVVISNKENVQTISVTITNTTTEHKSYSKERHGKAGAGMGVGPAGDAKETDVSGDAATPPMIEAPPPQSGGRGDAASYEKPASDKRYQRGTTSRQDSGEQTRPKRYSSQRQRNMMELGYGEPHPQQTQPPPLQQQPLQQQPLQHQPQPQQQQQLQQKQQQQKQLQQQQQQPPPSQQQQKKAVGLDSGSGYYKQAVYPPSHPPAPMFHPELAGTQRPGHPPPPQDPTAYSTAMLQPPISFHLPVSSPGMPSPPRLMGPNMTTAPPGAVPVSINNASPQLLPAPYLAGPGVIYTAPPPPPGASPSYQVTMGYTSPPPSAPPPSLAQQQSVASGQSQPEVHRGGTVYFPPYLQQPASRSPARRQKVAIPIVDPTELKKKASGEGSPTPTTTEGAGGAVTQDGSYREREGQTVVQDAISADVPGKAVFKLPDSAPSKAEAVISVPNVSTTKADMKLPDESSTKADLSAMVLDGPGSTTSQVNQSAAVINQPGPVSIKAEMAAAEMLSEGVVSEPSAQPVRGESSSDDNLPRPGNSGVGTDLPGQDSSSHSKGVQGDLPTAQPAPVTTDTSPSPSPSLSEAADSASSVSKLDVAPVVAETGVQDGVSEWSPNREASASVDSNVPVQSEAVATS